MTNSSTTPFITMADANADLQAMEKGFAMMHDLMEPAAMSTAERDDMINKCNDMIGWLDEQIAQSMRMRDLLIKIGAKLR